MANKNSNRVRSKQLKKLHEFEFVIIKYLYTITLRVRIRYEYVYVIANPVPKIRNLFSQRSLRSPRLIFLSTNPLTVLHRFSDCNFSLRNLAV